MQVEIKIDPQYESPKVLVLTREITEEVNDIIKRLSQEKPQLLAGYREDTLEILEESRIVRIYAQSGKVCAMTDRGTYFLRARLYELEERLDRSSFVRISNSEMINLKQVTGFDLSFAGTICVGLANGDTTYVSRRYVSKIKKY